MSPSIALGKLSVTSYQLLVISHTVVIFDKGIAIRVQSLIIIRYFVN